MSDAPERVVVIGAGAIGATCAALLQEAGARCVIVARGEARDAIGARGIALRTPSGGREVRVEVAASVADARCTARDLAIVATMGHDTRAAVAGLAADVPVASFQNGLAPLDELRGRAHVLAAVVYVPAERRAPGVVALPGTPVAGAVLVGAWPRGVTPLARWLVEHLRGLRAEVEPEIERWVRAKLLTNLGGIVVALCDDPPLDVIRAAQDEARAVWSAEGAAFASVEELLERVGPLGEAPVDGAARQGGSTRAALARGAPRLETAALHGPIVDAGRRVGVPTPWNERLIALSERATRERWAAGAMPASTLRELLARPAAFWVDPPGRGG